MASLIYDSTLDDEKRGNIDYDTDTFKLMLVGAAYTPDKATHLKRSDVTSEVAGAGYTAGGAVVTIGINKDTTNHRLDITPSNPSWPASTITNARAGVLYKSRGGAASADELVGYIDFLTNVSSTGATFSVTITSPYRTQN